MTKGGELDDTKGRILDGHLILPSQGILQPDEDDDS